MYDFLIVGSGLYGSTFAYKLKQAGKTGLVIDKRPNLGGNVFCKEVEGIQVHQYGAHIFHTNDLNLWNFVNQFVPFKPFINTPIASYYGKHFNLPFNLNTFKQLWGVATEQQAKAKLAEATAPYLNAYPKNLEEQALCLVGEEIYEKIIKHYSEKQWGKKCTDLPAFLLKRLPLRFTADNNYFNDKYQGIPIGGYNKLIDGLLNGIETITGVDFLMDKQGWMQKAKQVLYTGKIDAYFNYSLGQLEYRSLRFEEKVFYNQPNYQGNAVFNYTSPDVPYTRVIEHKHFEGTQNEHTVVSFEYPMKYTVGGEAYYPVNDEKNLQLYNQYKKLAEQEPHVIFGGRLAEYKYYDMHQVIAAALTKSNQILHA